MKDKRCFICKYQGIITLETTNSVLYGSREKQMAIPLCYSHSIDLFKMGQANFKLKYKNTFENSYGSEEDKQAINYF